MNEGSRLAARAAHGHRIADGRLHDKTIQHRAIVSVIVEAVDQAIVQFGFGRLSAPDDALVELSRAQFVVLNVKLKE